MEIAQGFLHMVFFTLSCLIVVIQQNHLISLEIEQELFSNGNWAELEESGFQSKLCFYYVQITYSNLISVITSLLLCNVALHIPPLRVTMLCMQTYQIVSVQYLLILFPFAEISHGL